MMKLLVLDIWLGNKHLLPQLKSHPLQHPVVYREVTPSLRIREDYRVLRAHRRLLKVMNGPLDLKKLKFMKTEGKKWAMLKGNWLLAWMDINVFFLDWLVGA
jgi:hypothetical protein